MFREKTKFSTGLGTRKWRGNKINSKMITCSHGCLRLCLRHFIYLSWVGLVFEIFHPIPRDAPGAQSSVLDL